MCSWSHGCTTTYLRTTSSSASPSGCSGIEPGSNRSARRRKTCCSDQPPLVWSWSDQWRDGSVNRLLASGHVIGQEVVTCHRWSCSRDFNHVSDWSFFFITSILTRSNCKETLSPGEQIKDSDWFLIDWIRPNQLFCRKLESSFGAMSDKTKNQSFSG